jgi:pimeloyl-ACP methyl ester carboxylesterase
MRMTGFRTEKVPLATGVAINTFLGGKPDAEAILLLHGFPESHRTWRNQLPVLARDFFVVAPDQRGFGGSDKPEGVENYETDKIVDDVMALADALAVKHFTLVGHDWGGAVAWAAALQHPLRVKRLVIVNAPHPLIFQNSLVEDEAQRAASQYINVLRSPTAEAWIRAMGLERFLDKVLLGDADATRLEPEERQAYLDDWSQPGALTAMLNWYRAAKIEVPAPGEEAKAPLWTKLPFPHIRQPTLIVWGLKDRALLPVQLEGLHGLVNDLRIVTSASASHFITWEEPETVTSAICDFLADTAQD